MKKETIQLVAITILLSSIVCLINSCKKTVPNEEELITTIQLKLTDQTTGLSAVYQFRDPDGDGGNNPIQFDTIKILQNKIYNCSITLLDESKTPALDITAEVQNEGIDHQFYIASSAGLNNAISQLNVDANNLPLGITSVWTTAAASNGKVQITLKHKPGIKAAGDAITIGETDVELPNGGFYTIIL